MLLRLPWLISRRRLLVALLVVSALFALLYTAFFLGCFGVWPAWDLPLGGLLGFWLIGSYVIGRYYDAQEMRSAAVIKQAIRTLITLLLSIGVFLSWLWLTASPAVAQTSRGFMLPMLLVFAPCSGLLQQGVNRLLEGRFGSRALWLVLREAGFQRLSCIRSWVGAGWRPGCSRWISTQPGCLARSRPERRAQRPRGGIV